MSRIALHIDYSLCTGCKICQLVCSEKKYGFYIPDRALLKIEEHNEVYNTPVICMHCENTACEIVCPVRAISKNNDGIVVIDNEKCIGCGICKKYCPQQIIVLYIDESKKRKAHKCDLCGGFPQCSASCPTGALSIVRR